MSRDVAALFIAEGELIRQVEYWRRLFGTASLNDLTAGGVLLVPRPEHLDGLVGAYDFGLGPEEYELHAAEGGVAAVSVQTGETVAKSIAPSQFYTFSRDRFSSFLRTRNNFDAWEVAVPYGFFPIGRRQVGTRFLFWVVCTDPVRLQDPTVQGALEKVAESDGVVVVSHGERSPTVEFRPASPRVAFVGVPHSEKGWNLEWTRACLSRSDLRGAQVMEIFYRICGIRLLVDIDAGEVYLDGKDLGVRGTSQAFSLVRELAREPGAEFDKETFGKERLKNKNHLAPMQKVDDALNEVRKKIRAVFPDEPEQADCRKLFEGGTRGKVGLHLGKKAVVVWKK